MCHAPYFIHKDDVELYEQIKPILDEMREKARKIPYIGRDRDPDAVIALTNEYQETISLYNQIRMIVSPESWDHENIPDYVKFFAGYKI